MFDSENPDLGNYSTESSHLRPLMNSMHTTAGYVGSTEPPSTMFIQAPESQETKLSFHIATNNSILFSIKPDGTIERGPSFTTEDEMSLKFWDLVANSFGLWRENAKAR